MKFSDFKKNIFPQENFPSPQKTEEKRFEKEQPVIARTEPSPAQDEKAGIPPPAPAVAVFPDNMRFSIKTEGKPRGSRPDFKDKEKEYLERARIVYSRALGISREIFSSLNKPYAEKYPEIDYIVRALRSETRGNPFFPGMVSYLTPSNYLYSHSVNVAIISMGAAAALNMTEEEALKTGIAAFLHDAGMPEYLELSRLDRKLDESEKETMKGHVASGLEKLDKIMDFEREAKEFAVNVISRHHERADGSGYPLGISGEDLDVYSGIVGAADVYEAMTHKRSWRDATEQPKVIKRFIGSMKELFPAKALKGIVSFLSLYPMGSTVSLSTGEIGVVSALNKGSFSRPVVKILLDGDFNQVRESYIDLMEYPLTSIETEVSYAELAKKNPGFYSDFEFSNFWVDW